MIKHVGRLVKSKRRVVVAYRVVPGDADSCLVIATATLSADEHDSLMKVVESAVGQEADDLALVLDRSPLPDGRLMLRAFHATGKLQKMPTNEVELIPNQKTSIRLDELNNLIAQQQGISVEDLALTDPSQKTPTDTSEAVVAEAPIANTNTHDVLSDEELAASYRSQADAMFKEAKKLREQAEDLFPTKKKKKAEVSE